MFPCNIRSLQKKNSFACNEYFLYFIDKKTQILAITETRLNANTACNELYHTVSRTSAGHGGAAIYITKDLLRRAVRPSGLAHFT